MRHGKASQAGAGAIPDNAPRRRKLRKPNYGISLGGRFQIFLIYPRRMTDSPGADLHVVSLRFLLRHNERVTYVNPKPLEFETDEACFQLADGNLTCEMKTHFSTAEAARLAVDPILKAWEADADLQSNRAGELRFEFGGAEIVDRSPTVPGVIRGNIHVVLRPLRVSGEIVSAHAERDHYPEPPGTFRLNPDVESMVHRYLNYQNELEPLSGMAYFCLTVFEAQAGGRREAAKTYEIQKAVLDMIGKLTSKYGSPSTARKARTLRPLTGPERAWLEAAVRKLILRLGETHTAARLPLITMSDLPSL